MEYLTLGIIKGSFGLDGALKVFSTTDSAKKRYVKGKKVFIYHPKNQQLKELTVLDFHQNGVFDIVKVEEITTKEEAEELQGYELKVIKDEKDLDEGYYFFGDLVNCEIVDESGEPLGKVKDVEEFPAQATLRVERVGNRDFFVPFISEFIVKVDIQAKVITIKVMEGML